EALPDDRRERGLRRRRRGEPRHRARRGRAGHRDARRAVAVGPTQRRDDGPATAHGASLLPRRTRVAPAPRRAGSRRANGTRLRRHARRRGDPRALPFRRRSLDGARERRPRRARPLLRSRGSGRRAGPFAPAPSRALARPPRVRRARRSAARRCALTPRRLAPPRDRVVDSTRSAARARPWLGVDRAGPSRARRGDRVRRRAHRSPRVQAGRPRARLLERRMSAAVDVRDAFRIFGSGSAASVALQGLTLEVEAGELVCVLGPGGSGKTTLLRVVAGLERLSAGGVRVFGTDLARLGKAELLAFRAGTFGFLDQHYARALSPDLSIRDTVALRLLLPGAST